MVSVNRVDVLSAFTVCVNMSNSRRLLVVSEGRGNCIIP